MIRLRDYQEVGVQFLLDKKKAILADQMGLGKTYTAIAAAQAVVPQGPILVICPAYLIEQWKLAIIDYAPGRVGDIAELSARTKAAQRIEALADGQVVWYVASYGMLTRMLELQRVVWPVVIIDEAHRLRNHKAKQTKAAQRLKAEHTFLLTGTPLVKGPADIQPLLKLCDPTQFSRHWDFVNTWCVIRRTPWATIPEGLLPDKEAAFHDLLDDYMLRRRLEDHLHELPERIETVIPVELSKAAMKTHKQIKKEWWVEHPDLESPQALLSSGALIPRLRQVTAGYIRTETETIELADNQKLATLKDHLEDTGDEPVIVFCWYKASAYLVSNDLEMTTDRGTFVITGDVPAQHRNAVIAQWKAQPAGILVATIGAMAEGANLQHAANVIFYEGHYVRANIEQAIGRVHRMGQDRPVNITHLIAKGTIDEAIWRVAQRRDEQNERALLYELAKQA